MDWLPLLATGTTTAPAASPTTTSEDNPFQPVLDFFDSATFQAGVKLIGVAVATAIVFPFVGVLIYVILRPPEYLDDVRERELEIRAMERRLGADHRCPYCRSEIESSFLICPVCTTKLRQACVTCKQPLDPLWQVCPYCETPIVRRTPVFEETMALSTKELHEPLRTPRRRRRGVAEGAAEDLAGDQ